MRHITAYLSLGSNLGDRAKHLEQALAALEREGIEIVRRSSLYETEPRDFIDQPWFLNMVVECRTKLFPQQLLSRLLRVERELGRTRGPDAVQRGPRTVDLDILLYGTLVIRTQQLTVPHPRMLERRFVLEPLLEIAPDLHYPGTNLLLSRHLPGVAAQKLIKTEPGKRFQEE